MQIVVYCEAGDPFAYCTCINKPWPALPAISPEHRRLLLIPTTGRSHASKRVALQRRQIWRKQGGRRSSNGFSEVGLPAHREAGVCTNGACLRSHQEPLRSAARASGHLGTSRNLSGGPAAELSDGRGLSFQAALASQRPLYVSYGALARYNT